MLELGNPHSSLALVDEDEKPTIHIMEGLTTCRNPNVTIINESGLYGLILSSRKPEATDEKGEPWFVAKEVCDVLGLGKVGQAVTSLDDNEKNTIIINDGIPGNPNRLIINEPGLYGLVLRSRKPEAKAFKKWVKHEVLPKIRKTGHYGKGPMELDRAIQQKYKKEVRRGTDRKV